MSAMQWEKAVQFATFQSLTLSQRRELCVCVQRSSALLLPWSKGEGEEGEHVAYLALDCRDQQLFSGILQNLPLLGDSGWYYVPHLGEDWNGSCVSSFYLSYLSAVTPWLYCAWHYLFTNRWLDKFWFWCSHGNCCLQGMIIWRSHILFCKCIVVQLSIWVRCLVDGSLGHIQRHQFRMKQQLRRRIQSTYSSWFFFNLNVLLLFTFSG